MNTSGDPRPLVTPLFNLKVSALGVLVLAVLTSVFSAEPKQLLGPVEEASVLDEFTSESKAAWQLTAGSNVRYEFDTGRNIPGVASSVCQIELSSKDADDRV